MAQTDAVTLRPAADADLTAIWQDGARRWGVARADRYADGLFALFALLAEFPDLARPRSEFVPPVRIHPSGAHLVIYLPTPPGIEIIRILHAHQHLSAYLQQG